MSIKKTIMIGEIGVLMQADASIPRLYRLKFGGDIIAEMAKFKTFKTDDGKTNVEITDMAVFENLAYIMAKQADMQNVPEDINEWLSQFELFDIYNALPDMLDLWALNSVTTSDSKKKLNLLNGN